MPTSRTITSILLAILLAAAHLTTGNPISSPAQPDTQARSPHNTHDRRGGGGGGTPDLSRLTLPTIAGAATPLPTPPAGYKLKHVALGVGTQNYTCSSNVNGSAEAAVATPSSAGALASLWDIGPFLSSPLGRLFEDALPPLALAMYGALSPSSSSSSSAAAEHTWWDAVIAQMPWESTTTTGSSSADAGLPSAAFGEHFFSSTLTPTWALFPPAGAGAGAADVVFQGTKEGSAPAPADACPGLGGEGAVPWLYLTKAASTDDGIAAVYRVVTAGGTARPDACAGLGEAGGEVEVKYAAEYWFYGP